MVSSEVYTDSELTIVLINRLLNSLSQYTNRNRIEVLLLCHIVVHLKVMEINCDKVNRAL